MREEHLFVLSKKIIGIVAPNGTVIAAMLEVEPPDAAPYVRWCERTAG